MSAGTAVAESTAISLPSGGGGIAGLGEKFNADLSTGTGSFTVPISVPPGRHGLAPELVLGYSAGHGNGLYGAGWRLTLPGISRKTSKGVPRYTDEDTYVLSGAEDLVRVAGAYPGRVRYRPRTEGTFARIEHVRATDSDHWEVRGRDGLVHTYGEVTRTPDGDVYAWHLTGTVDPLGNRIRYTYTHHDGQPLLARVEWADYGDRAAPSFLAAVEFTYEERPDPVTEGRTGFVLRTTRRCRLIRVLTQAADGLRRTVREYRLGYTQAPFNGASLLSTVEVVGIDGELEQPHAPLVFAYTSFAPDRRRFTTVTGTALPAGPWSDPRLALVDVRGTGLPDVVELGTAQRYWANRGGGRFDPPRSLGDGPPHALDEPGVRFLDANGDGRADLLVSTAGRAGYYPLTYAGAWSRRSFQPYRRVPSVGLADPAVHLVDLDGDGLTDALRSGPTLECWFNDPDPAQAWRRRATGSGPDIDLRDPHVRLADMTGDGLADIVVVHSGNIAYWPNLGYGRFGEPVRMSHAPRLPAGYDPRRVLLGDVDGDGAADLVYVDHRRVLVWGNRTGAGWTEEPIAVAGTPMVADADDVQLVDLLGTGLAGLLWTSTRTAPRFLDLCGGRKPYLLSTVDNNTGAVTTISYRPSTVDYLRDAGDPATRWRTTLPFPVHVVASIEVHDQISGGRLVTEYRYRHGYWDGIEREFRGFGLVEQIDSELLGHDAGADLVGGDPGASAPTLMRNWFHLGPVAASEPNDWTELDYRAEFWTGDAPQLPRPTQADLPSGLTRREWRDALRTLRGQLLRTELYALDGTARADRPYTVTEFTAGLRVEAPGVYYPYAVGQRETRYERGDEPMTKFSLSTAYDAYGFANAALSLAVPRRTGDPYLATHTTTEYARRDDAAGYLVDRVCRATTYEVVNDGSQSLLEFVGSVLSGQATLRVVARERTFYDGDAYVGLPAGQLGVHGLPTRVESLAFTDELLSALNDSPPTDAGYRHDADGWYVAARRHRYDVHDSARPPRGLPIASLDAFGAESTVDYDEHDLFPVLTTDPAGLSTSASYDYRVLRPYEVTDPNGNRSAVAFSPDGLVSAQFLRGEEGEGDTTEPSIRIRHDLLAFAERRQPVSVRTTRRVSHDPAVDTALVSVEFFDGLGRSVQTRALAEDTRYGDGVFGGDVLPADQAVPVPPLRVSTRPPGAPDNVVVSGWQVYDNKGRVVEKYQPFFATGWEFGAPGDAELGEKTRYRYDPRGQVVRTTHPDGSEQRVVLGVPDDLTNPDLFRPTPWETYTYDGNDNAGRTHGLTAQSYATHWNTPSSIEVDALGRPVVATARTDDQPVVVRTAYDIRGNRTEVVDALDRVAYQFTHDLAGRCWRVDSLDAGRRDTRPDAAGNPIEVRDGRGASRRTEYDVLRRPVRVWAREDAASPLTLRQLIQYGDDPAVLAPSEARAHNLLGRAVRHYDEAGLVTVAHVDFQGNVVEASRRVIADAPILASYAPAPANGWTVTPFRVDWQPAPGQTRAERDAELLEPTGYSTNTEFDALNRVVRQVLPTDVEGQRRVLTPSYHRGGGLARLSLNGQPYVDTIGYDAAGQRTVVKYGNGVTTRYAYDPRTFRLTRLYSATTTGEVLQDLGFTHDVVGNVLTMRDKAGQPVDRQYAYDPLYRLVSGSGREYDVALDGPPWTDVPRGTDLTQTRPYTETYQYDANGSLLRLSHKSAGGYTREYTIDPDTNRVLRLTASGTPFDLTYDVNGNLRTEAATRHYDWDHADRLVAFGTQTAGAEPSVHAQYLYDAAGKRVKKLTRRQGGAIEVTHYVGEVFEHHRWAGGANNHVHVLDNAQRIALVRLGPAHPDDGGPAVAYHLADHLGSSAVVVDSSGSFTRREEFTPYGETSFGGYAKKRYRFTGKERDEESGLTYHGARYYAPWTGTWCSTDPSGLASGVHPYRYCDGNPVAFVDRDGKDFTAVFDFDNNRVTLRSLFIVNTADEERQLTRAVSAYQRASSTYNGWHVTFDIQIRRVDRPNRDGTNQPLDRNIFQALIKRLPSFENQAMIPLANFYTAGTNRAANEAPIEGEKFVGGTAWGAHNIVMNRHTKYGDLGEYVDAVRHEVAHTFGLDDKHDGPTGRYFVKNAITDYDFLTRLRDGKPPGGFDLAGIGTAVTNRIMDFVYDYDPAMTQPGNPQHIPNTPRIGITSIEGGVSREFATFDAMWADHTSRVVNHLLDGLKP